MSWLRCFGPSTHSAEQSWTCKTRVPSVKTTHTSAGQCFLSVSVYFTRQVHLRCPRQLPYLLSSQRLKEEEGFRLIYPYYRMKKMMLIFHSVLVNSERTRRQPSWLKRPTSCLTPLNLITCGTTSLAGSKSAAGVFLEMSASQNCNCLMGGSAWI